MKHNNNENPLNCLAEVASREIPPIPAPLRRTHAQFFAPDSNNPPVTGKRPCPETIEVPPKERRVCFTPMPPYQKQLELLCQILTKNNLPREGAAYLLTHIADFYVEKFKTAAIALIQNELYNYALIFAKNTGLEAHTLQLQISKRIEDLRSVYAKVFSENKRYAQEQMPLQDTLTGTIVNDFINIFSNNLIEIDAIYTARSTFDVNQLFGHLAKKLCGKRFITEEERDEMYNSAGLKSLEPIHQAQM